MSIKYVVYDSNNKLILHSSVDEPSAYINKDIYYVSTIKSHELFVLDVIPNSVFLYDLLKALNMFFRGTDYKILGFDVSVYKPTGKLYVPLYKDKNTQINLFLSSNAKLSSDVGQYFIFSFVNQFKTYTISTDNVFVLLNELYEADALYKFTEEYLLKEFLMNSMLTVQKTSKYNV